ncbi:HD domain-containing protein [Candidatus Methanocrinis natronophilus]|uniref:ATP-binding protein n=1 Tax=Candidatus Methanocrinis natronophilus TaxID=3033396 RepID=A0ABT5X5I2_9EURY|nr:ATP-binding protein [Candidatus Methanocrinis natronophilus]MDF0589940.1 ATP-binding protein [Candidatus Methanocrinis natronophilus]
MKNNDNQKNLPKCGLIQALAEKANQRDDIGFNVLGRLDEFRQRVTGEVRQINELFPEYTPHDEVYHLKRLFYVADTVLGEERINSMNVGELFVLSVALYGHDWGMAVNGIEKDYIINDRIPNDTNPEEMWILPDERNRFKLFARDQQLLDDDGNLKDISVEIWREYVRQTHSFRSGEKIRKFFEPIDGGVADAASRVCIGHWLDFESLQDHDSFPINFSTMRDVVNIRALAVYLRLIDLLDLAEDRTPYVIWKFVAPRNSRSKMEWLKHRALRTVTCPAYLEGRVIRVDGSTDDHNVYAALEDFRIWCEIQLRGCTDVLARMNDPRHKLDIYHIDWHIDARGFKKTSIGFKFDRERMFEILGSEIYQGDHYVFLRELLQNSIDAIRMRREILLKYAKIEASNLGVINVDVKHIDDNIIITWRDDGIGMDEYMVENYLAVAGKSYYWSQDYEKFGLTMDPISRFGIGILSCFIVADSIEIETYKDPNLFPRSEPLRITIPDQNKQFRIQILSDVGLRIGTTIRVYINKKKISHDNNMFSFMKITEYLSIIAGFVEFPIVIDEDNRKTIIIHPNQNGEMIKERLGEDYTIQQLDLNYPFSDVFMPQDLSNAKELLRENKFDINSDLGFSDFEGSLTCLVPKSEEMQVGSTGGIYVRGVKVDKNIRSIRQKGIRRKEELGFSSISRKNISIYKDGILVPLDETFYSSLSYSNSKFDSSSLISLRINLSKKKAPSLDVSRKRFYEKDEPWFSPIRTKYVEKINEIYIDKLSSLDPFERLYLMGWIIYQYPLISIKDLWDVFPNDLWPIFSLKAGGELNVVKFKDIKKIKIDAFPCNTNLNLGELKSFISSKVNKYNYSGYINKWAGNEAIMVPSDDFLVIRSSRSFTSTPVGLKASEIIEFPIHKSYFASSIKFNNPPWVGNPPLYQVELSPNEPLKENIDKFLLLEKAIQNPRSLTAFELNQLSEMTHTRVANFSKPFDNLFGYGRELMNINHPVVQELIRIFCSIDINDSLPEIKRGEFNDLKYNLFNFGLTSSSEKLKHINKNLNKIFLFCEKNSIMDYFATDILTLKYNDFVPGTLNNRKIRVTKDIPFFGEQL